MKQKKKLGHVIRISPSLWKKISKERREKESSSAILERLIAGDSTENKTYFILPEAKIVCDTIEEARGKAILLAVRSGMKRPKEKPIEVQEV